MTDELTITTNVLFKIEESMPDGISFPDLVKETKLSEIEVHQGVGQLSDIGIVKIKMLPTDEGWRYHFFANDIAIYVSKLIKKNRSDQNDRI